MKRSSAPIKRGRRLRTKETEWDRVRATLKPRFEAAGITRCERCGSGFCLSFAHSVKRRFLQKDAELGAPEHIETVILACQVCHDELDLKMSHTEMRETVMRTISQRRKQP